MTNPGRQNIQSPVPKHRRHEVCVLAVVEVRTQTEIIEYILFHQKTETFISAYMEKNIESMLLEVSKASH
jgi:hypothetical protein